MFEVDEGTTAQARSPASPIDNVVNIGGAAHLAGGKPTLK